MSNIQQSKVTLYFDGASRNNPGPSGAGILIKKNDITVYEAGFYLGTKTNNEAEYFALVIGLFNAQKFLQDEAMLEIFSDSQLIVRQISGIYKTKKLELKNIHNIAVHVLKNLNYHINHVPREQNIEADKLANLAINKKISLQQDFLDFLKAHDIIFVF